MSACAEQMQYPVGQTVTTEAQQNEQKTPGVAASNRLRTAGLVMATALLGAACILSIAVGARQIALPTIADAVFAYDDGVDEHVMIMQLRVPRTLAAIVVGPALGLCGAIIQAFTRNPLADPGILGVNAGSTLAVTVAVVLLGITAPLGYVWFALIGAAIVTVFVYLLGSLGSSRATPARLTLAGVAISAALGGLTTAMTLSNREAFDDLRFWGVGSVGGRDLGVILAFSPFIIVGIVLAFAVARPLNALALGDELATSFGVRLAAVRVVALVATTLLAGTATALAGPIAFVGLMVPHAVRWIVGPDQRWIFAYTAIAAPILLLVSDIVGRIVLPSGELRVGLVTAIVGAPVLILLARRKRVSGL